MRKLSLLALLGALVPACNHGVTDKLALPHQTNTFQVEIVSVTTPDGKALQPGDGASEPTAWPFPLGNVKFHIKAQALDERGQPFTDLNRVVAIRVTPGDINPATRTLTAVNGLVEGDVLAAHVFGRANVWVLDAPADAVFGDGGVPVVPSPPSALPDGSHYSNAAGASPSLFFKRPTLSDVQRQPLCDPTKSFNPPRASCTTNTDCLDVAHNTQYACYQHTCLGPCDNRLSPLKGDFVTVEEPYTSDDAGMIITAVTQDGFYVQDLSGQRYSVADDPSVAAWQALPGHFGQLFVYTYSAPTNLYVGDHLSSLAGSLEEFSGDTQLDFPSWVKVDQQPTPAFLPAPTPLTLSTCGSDNVHALGGVQALCGYYNGGVAAMSLESLESGPVIIDFARPSNLFVNCDANGNGVLPLFANSKSQGGWYCFPGDPNGPECDCEIACITGEPRDLPNGGTLDYSSGADGGPTICTEKSTFDRFGQWEVVLADDHFGDGGVSTFSYGTRINVTTRDALPNFNPLDLEKPEYQGITFRVSGMLNQIQASRPRWLIYARDTADVCCHEAHLADGTTHHCPPGVSSCEAVAGH